MRIIWTLMALLLFGAMTSPARAVGDFSGDFSDDFDTSPTAAYIATSTFVIELKLANEYAALPRCAANRPRPCSEQAKVDELIRLGNSASLLVRKSEDVSRDQLASQDAKSSAIAAANSAISDLTAAIPPISK